MRGRLTLVAGAGDLPFHLATAAAHAGTAMQIIDLVGRDDLSGFATRHIAPAEAKALIEAVKQFGTTHVLLAGGVRLSDGDRRALATAFGVAGKLAAGLGDIGLAGLVLAYCKAQRIKLVGAHEAAPELVAPEGQIAGPPLGAGMAAAASAALRAARAVGALDLGQAVVLSGERPIAAEDAAGTDALLERVAQLRAAGLAGDGQPLILAKARKPRQPAFADLPAIGPETVRRAAAAGIAAIVVEAGATLLLVRGELEREAAARKVTIAGLKRG